MRSMYFYLAHFLLCNHQIFPGTEEGLYEPSHSPKKADFENLETHIQQIGQVTGKNISPCFVMMW